MSLPHARDHSFAALLSLCVCVRKERRVFETYIQECRAGQERKDREEMEALRNEVSIWY